MHINPSVWRLSQEDCHERMSSLCYIVSTSSVRTTQQDCQRKTDRREGKEWEERVESRGKNFINK